MASTPKYLRPYELAEQIHGPNFRTTLWNSRASQRIRFEIMAETCRQAGGAGRRILDAGCGLGDFLAFLEEVGQPPAHYAGIDALPSIIAEARQRKFATPTEFHVGDIVAQPELFATGAEGSSEGGSEGSPEVIVISGTLNTLAEKDFFATLDRAFDAAGQCLLFNFLSTQHAKAFTPGDGMIQRMDPVKVFAHGLPLTRKIIVRHDYYEGHDCTMAWIKVAV